jgi:uncharacterized protein YndB with AHSA1/START domain
MIHIEETIRAPRERVWRELIDHAGMVHWAGVRSSSLRREGVPAPNGVGAERVLGILPGLSVVEQVRRFEPPALLGYAIIEGMPGLASHVGTVTLAEQGDATRVDWDIDLRFRPLHPMWILAPVTRRALRDGVARAIANLKRRLESEPR